MSVKQRKPKLDVNGKPPAEIRAGHHERRPPPEPGRRRGQRPAKARTKIENHRELRVRCQQAARRLATGAIVRRPCSRRHWRARPSAAPARPAFWLWRFRGTLSRASPSNDSRADGESARTVSEISCAIGGRSGGGKNLFIPLTDALLCDGISDPLAVWNSASPGFRKILSADLQKLEDWLAQSPENAKRDKAKYYRELSEGRLASVRIRRQHRSAGRLKTPFADTVTAGGRS